MKLYQVVTTSKADEFEDYLGTDLNEANEAKKRALTAYENLSSHDKAQSEVECRVYDIDDSTDTSDRDELINAMIDCCGYNIF